MNGTRAHGKRYLRQRLKAAKGFTCANDFNTERTHAQRSLSSSTSDAESDTAPNTPPCILTMCSAAR